MRSSGLAYTVLSLADICALENIYVKCLLKPVLPNLHSKNRSAKVLLAKAVINMHLEIPCNCFESTGLACK